MATFSGDVQYTQNGPFIDEFPIKTSIYKGFSMAISMAIFKCYVSSPEGTKQTQSHLKKNWETPTGSN